MTTYISNAPVAQVPFVTPHGQPPAWPTANGPWQYATYYTPYSTAATPLTLKTKLKRAKSFLKTPKSALATPMGLPNVLPTTALGCKDPYHPQGPHVHAGNAVVYPQSAPQIPQSLPQWPNFAPTVQTAQATPLQSTPYQIITNHVPALGTPWYQPAQLQVDSSDEESEEEEEEVNPAPIFPKNQQTPIEMVKVLNLRWNNATKTAQVSHALQVVTFGGTIALHHILQQDNGFCRLIHFNVLAPKDELTVYALDKDTVMEAYATNPPLFEITLVFPDLNNLKTVVRKKQGVKLGHLFDKISSKVHQMLPSMDYNLRTDEERRGIDAMYWHWRREGVLNTRYLIRGDALGNKTLFDQIQPTDVAGVYQVLLRES